MKLYAQLPKHCKLMTKEELLVYFPEGMETKTDKNGNEYKVPLHYTQAFLFRSMIINESVFGNNNNEPRTLRSIWYSTVKPTLDKLGLLRDEDSNEDQLRRWDAILSNYVCDLLRKGIVSFLDLNIYDISRKKSNPSQSYLTVNQKVYGYKANIAPYPNIIIATEKDTVYSVISKIAELYGTSCISCKGQNSLGAMEILVRRMFYSHVKFNSIYILTMTDYDPAGYYIADALKSQVEDILNLLNKTHIKVIYHRIGIEPIQLEKSQVYENMYSPKKTNLDKWMGKTNGIDGMRKGLELDALSNDQIRHIFIDELENFIDNNIYKEFIKKSFLRRKILEELEDSVEEIFDLIYNEFKNDIEIIDNFSVKKLALEKRDGFPVEQMCKEEDKYAVSERIKQILTLNLD